MSTSTKLWRTISRWGRGRSNEGKRNQSKIVIILGIDRKSSVCVETRWSLESEIPGSLLHDGVEGDAHGCAFSSLVNFGSLISSI